MDQCKHSKSMDWIDWKLSKSEAIHSLKWKKISGIGRIPATNRNHSTYWIVNHWNRFKLVNIVSVILLATLNWRIYHNYNQFKLDQLEGIHAISVIVHLWFEVLNWYWIFEWLDLPNLQSITLYDYAFCNSEIYGIYNLDSLESIEIGNSCFGSVKSFQIDGLNRLKTIKIGKNSFTQKKNSYGNDSSKSFHILNCESLESIQIGEFSFNDFAGEFELKNLPQLQSIQIGTIGSSSCNFYFSSFVIAGIEMILNIVMIRSSKSTIHYIGW